MIELTMEIEGIRMKASDRNYGANRRKEEASGDNKRVYLCVKINHNIGNKILMHRFTTK